MANQITGHAFKKMLVAGARNLANHSDIVDKLNVFPVPDGDTGKNMTMTFTAGATKVGTSQEQSIGVLTKQLSRELLMGARGNSGVILSQLFRGFATGLDGLEVATIEDLAKALDSGVKTAYKAVMKPVEGTILTVARQSAAATLERYEEMTDVVAFYEFVVEEMKKSLAGTPDLLPVLKEAGVIDSGGQGLVYVYEGFLKALKGEEVQLEAQTVDMSTSHDLGFESDEFGYCTEFIVRLDEERPAFNEAMFRQKLGELGDSIVVVQDEDIVKVHVHTLTPGDALNMAQRHGEFVSLKIENMTEQHNEVIGKLRHEETPAAADTIKEFGVIAVVSGAGVKTLFEAAGAHDIIEGGQTMNPSTEDFIKAIEALNAKNVIILPNNSNIIMAANQAKDVVSDVNVAVIPTKTIPQGYAALALYNGNSTLSQMEKEMTLVIAGVKSGAVTYAVRDTTMNGVEIKKDDFIGILDKDIVVSLADRTQAAEALLVNMLDEDSELVTLIYGEGTTEEEATKLAEFVEEKCPDAEVSVVQGDQPVYSYIIAVE
ncbi:MAG: DAK2 domain-containing protein [Defluviitaleaceae bacterium]|nr:DAK2 domain-containing protein [Defluviitaleaceae bacterium]